MLATSAFTLGGASVSASDTASGHDRPSCTKLSPGQPTESASSSVPTSIATLEQAYNCIIDNHVDGDDLNTRTLLADAFSGLAAELDSRGLDLATATMPALTGKRDEDWDRFSDVYEEVLAELPDDAELHEALASASILAMVEGMHDNHTRWAPPAEPTTSYSLGITVANPSAYPEVFIRSVQGAPAADQDLLPGDIITSVNGLPTHINGKPVEGVIDWLNAPSAEPVELALERPSTGETWTVTLTPAQSRPGPGDDVTVTRVADDIALVTLRAFTDGGTEEMLQEIAELEEDGPLEGIVLDVRQNSGGSVAEVARLLGAFVHDTPYGYVCDADYAKCTPKMTDDSIELLGLPLALLTSGQCPSACDAFAAAVQDLDLGVLVGSRTAGVVSGQSVPYVLDDGSQMLLPRDRGVGPDGEIINEIGVAPDHYVSPPTAEDLSAGEDRALDTAIDLLHGEEGALPR
ncbi:S41 family peptidase [Jiangella asiatica]|uniref:S41 family peptidase n=1 Tax=Jiangella asiatica TaxID=2530372 RepID=UPI0013A5E074|nr:S41 family peptidase [Jiangella asiatica]